MKSPQRFNDRAEDYVKGRPSYPMPAIDAIFEALGDAQRLSVVDLGAGTGISARLLAKRAARVIAVEPNAMMREAGECPANLTWQPNPAEHTGLPNASADIVTAFQAFHWFEHDPALHEMRRILRPGGRAAIVFNDRDESDAFTAAYGALARRFDKDANDPTARKNTDGRAAFAGFSGWTKVWSFEFENRQSLDRAALQARAASTSYLPKTGVPAESMRVALDALFREFAINDRVRMCLKTVVTLAH